MTWWADFWNGVARFFGYETWVWGSAGEWISGLFAAAAVIWAVRVFRHERSVEVKTEASALMFWHQAILTPTGEGTKTSVMGRIVFVNAGTRPASRISVIVPKDFEGRAFVRRYTSQSVLHSGASVEFDETQYPLSLIKGYVSYTDGSGREWYRDIKNGEYLTAKQVAELTPRINLDLGSLFPNKNPETVAWLKSMEESGDGHIELR